MDPLKNEIHPDMVKVWKVRAVIEEGIGILVILAYLFLMIKFDWWAWILYVLIGLTVALAPLEYFVFPKLRQRYYSYQLNEEELEIQHGLFVVKRVLVPMIRVQHVTIEQVDYEKIRFSRITHFNSSNFSQHPRLNDV